MGLFDQLKSFVGTATMVDLRGPLKLSPGDGVAYYREQFIVAGVRRLDAQGEVTWHYCLANEQGARAILAAEEGPEVLLAIHRPASPDLPWDGEVLEGLGGAPLKLAVRGHASVNSVGDTGGHASRSVSFRHFRDESGDRIAVFEEWGGQSEARVGETVLEAELAITRSEAEVEAAAEQEWYDGRHEPHAGKTGPQRGTAAAAARLLDGLHDAAQAKAEVVPHEDRDPTAYADDAWDDEPSGAPVEKPASIVVPSFDSEEEEWRAAARFLREQTAAAKK
jgi:hypothetical protein